MTGGTEAVRKGDVVPVSHSKHVSCLYNWWWCSNLVNRTFIQIILLHIWDIFHLRIWNLSKRGAYMPSSAFLTVHAFLTTGPRVERGHLIPEIKVSVSMSSSPCCGMFIISPVIAATASAQGVEVITGKTWNGYYRMLIIMTVVFQGK